MNRPIGVTLITVWYILIGIVLVLGGISLVALAGLAESGYIPGLVDFPFLGVILALGGAIAIIFIIIAVVEFIIAWGLLGGKGWAWTLTIVLTFLVIALELLSLTNPTAFTIIGLVINALIIYYLFKPNVKAFFGKGPAETYQPPATYQASQTPQVPPPPPQEAAQNIPACPNCGRPLTWIEQYQRWYCYNCQRYA